MSDDTPAAGQNITDLRAALFETLRAVRAGSIDLDKARMVNEIAKTLIDSGRAEIELARVTDRDPGTQFLHGQAAAGNGIAGVTRHLLK